MECSRFVRVAVVLGGLLGCSGRYEVGALSNGGESGVGSGVTEGGAFTSGAAGSGIAVGGAFVGTGVFVGYEASPPDGSSSGGSTSVPSPVGVAGAVAVAGASSAGAIAGASAVGFAGASSGSGYQPYLPSPSFCGQPIPLSHNTAFASPAVVWTRIQNFLRGGVVDQQPDLPPVTTRLWAAEQAMATLDSVGNDPIANAPYSSAPGLVRAIKRWLPDAEQAPHWASLFNGGASLGTLLTTQDGQKHGAGILTDSVILKQTNLVQRGKTISSNLLCATIPPPPPSVSVVLEETTSGLTRRDRFAAHENNPSCKACHVVFDPFGIGLEHFTPLTGVYGDIDNGHPIDSSSSATLQQTGVISFLDAPGLGAALATSCEVAQCLIQTLLTDALVSNGLPAPVPPDPAAVAEIGFASYQSGHNLRGLIWYLVQSDSFLQAP